MAWATFAVMVARSTRSGEVRSRHRGSSAPVRCPACLAPLRGGPRGVDPDDLDAAIGQEQGEHSGPTADVQGLTRRKLLRDADVRVEVTAIGVERVVDRGEPWMREALVSHAVERTRSRPRASTGFVGDPPKASWPRRSQFPGGPVQQPGADDRRLEHVAVGGVGGVGAGEFVDALQAVGQRAHAEREPSGGLGGDAAAVEVGGERVEEGLGAPQAVVSGPRVSRTRSAMAWRSRVRTG